jgi:hypothetical protein
VRNRLPYGLGWTDHLVVILGGGLDKINHPPFSLHEQSSCFIVETSSDLAIYEEEILSVAEQEKPTHRY